MVTHLFYFNRENITTKILTIQIVNLEIHIGNRSSYQWKNRK